MARFGHGANECGAVGMDVEDGSSADMIVSSVELDLFPFSDPSRWFTLEGVWSGGKSENPSSNCPWVAILTLSVKWSHQRKFCVVIGEHPRNVPFPALVLNLADCPVGGLTQTPHPKVMRLVQSSFFPVAICILLSEWVADGRELNILMAWIEA